MNTFLTENLKKQDLFTEDSFILENLFFLPKALPIDDYHLNILKNWNIDKIFSDGELTNKTAIKNEVKSEDPVDESGLEDIFEESDNLISPIDSEKVESAIVIEESNNDFKSTYKKWIITTVSFFNMIVNTKNIEKDKVVSLINEIKQITRKNKNECLKLFGKQFEGIPYIHRKTIETTILSYIISESMNMQEFPANNLMFATLFHDLGMAKIPKEILQKKEKLTKEEIVEIQNHTLHGYKLLREIGYSAIVSTGALQHHERIDGKGYSNHVTGDKITDIAKIIAVVDAYCAAIAERPFKDHLHAKEALQDLLKSGGTAYDPLILRELVKNISFYPIGSFVHLSNGDIAEVSGTSGVAMRPNVRLINNGNEEIDLSKRNDIFIKGIYSKKDQ